MITYPFSSRPRAYFLANFPGLQIPLQPTKDGWIVPNWKALGTGRPQPSAADVAGYQAPDRPLAPPHQIGPESAEPLTDVEIAIRQAASNFEQARLAAPKALDRLKGTIHTALVSGGMSSDEATAAGVGLVLIHGPVLAAFEAAGGHPVAAAALYQAIASKPSTDALPWLTKEILDVFAAFLVPK